jgi:uncharacterized membrane protein YjfL (UPF0719 family)
MLAPEIQQFLAGLGNTILWSVVAIVVVTILFEVLNRKYHLMREIFDENSTAAAILAGAFVIGVFYLVTQIVVN